MINKYMYKCMFHSPLVLCLDFLLPRILASKLSVLSKLRLDEAVISRFAGWGVWDAMRRR